MAMTKQGQPWKNKYQLCCQEGKSQAGSTEFGDCDFRARKIAWMRKVDEFFVIDKAVEMETVDDAIIDNGVWKDNELAKS